MSNNLQISQYTDSKGNKYVSLYMTGKVMKDGVYENVVHATTVEENWFFNEVNKLKDQENKTLHLVYLYDYEDFDCVGIFDSMPEAEKIANKLEAIIDGERTELIPNSNEYWQGATMMSFELNKIIEKYKNILS